jgi:hypothetical protein
MCRWAIGWPSPFGTCRDHSRLRGRLMQTETSAGADRGPATIYCRATMLGTLVKRLATRESRNSTVRAGGRVQTMPSCKQRSNAPYADKIQHGSRIHRGRCRNGRTDLYSPVSCEIFAVNEALIGKPELVNQDAEGAGWISNSPRPPNSTCSWTGRHISLTRETKVMRDLFDSLPGVCVFDPESPPRAIDGSHRKE